MRSTLAASLLCLAIVSSPAIAAPLLTVNYSATNAGACTMNSVAGVVSGQAIVGSVSNAAGPVIGNLSCTPSSAGNFTLTGTATANYNSVAIQATMGGIGTFEFGSTWTDTLTFNSPDHAALNMTIPWLESGSYTYNGFALTVGPGYLLNLGTSTIYDAGPFGFFCGVNTFCSGTHSLNHSYSSLPKTITTGQAYSFLFRFDAVLDDGLASGVISFNDDDPYIPNFQFTDPNTGAPVSDVTIQSASGTVFAVAPEPSAWTLASAGLLAGALFLRRRFLGN